MAAGVGLYPNGLDSMEVIQACQTSRSYHPGDCSISWCFKLTSAGTVITFLCSFIAFQYPKEKQIVTGHAL